MRSMDGTGLAVLIAAGDNFEEAVEIAQVQLACGGCGGPRPAASGGCGNCRKKTLQGDGGGRRFVRSSASIARIRPRWKPRCEDLHGQGHAVSAGPCFCRCWARAELAGALTDAEDKVVEALYGRPNWQATWHLPGH